MPGLARGALTLLLGLGQQLEAVQVKVLAEGGLRLQPADGKPHPAIEKTQPQQVALEEGKETGEARA